MKTFLLQHPEIAPEGRWLTIANEEEEDLYGEGSMLDDEVYFYLDGSRRVEDIKVGDIVELDEPFKVLEVEE